MRKIKSNFENVFLNKSADIIKKLNIKHFFKSNQNGDHFKNIPILFGRKKQFFFKTVI